MLDERQRRLYAAVEAKVLGHGGVKRVSVATGVARGSILAEIKELASPLRWTCRSLMQLARALREQGRAISETTQAALRAEQPVISVDTKKKELAGAGREREIEIIIRIALHQLLAPSARAPDPAGPVLHGPLR